MNAYCVGGICVLVQINIFSQMSGINLMLMFAITIFGQVIIFRTKEKEKSCLYYKPDFSYQVDDQ